MCDKCPDDLASNSQVRPGGGEWTPLLHRPHPLGILGIFGFHAKTTDFRTTAVAPPGNSLEPYLC